MGEESDSEWLMSDTGEDESDTEVKQPKTPKPRVRNKARDRDRSRTYRATMSEDQKLRYKEKAKMRMRKYRLKHKESGQKPSPSVQRKLRVKWRNAKRHQREKMTPDMKAEAAKRNLQRRIDMLSPKDFEQVLLSTTPRKRQYLKRRFIVNSPKTAKRLRVNTSIAEAFKSGLHDLRTMQDTESRAKKKLLGAIARKSRHASKVQKELNISYKSWRQYSKIGDQTSWVELQARKQRSDCLNEDTKSKVQDFFDSHSFAIPSKKHASKSVLTDTTKRLYKDFQAENSESHLIGLTSFKNLRPAHMLTVDKMKFIGCVCEYCINLDYMVSPLVLGIKLGCN